MEKYTIEQLQSLLHTTVSILKFDEADSYDGTINELVKDPEGDYVTLIQHGEEKFYIRDMEELYIHAEGNLPVFYSPLDNYEKETYSYPPDFFEGFLDYIGRGIKAYGLFEDGDFEVHGVLEEIMFDDLRLKIDEKPIELWRFNVIYLLENDGSFKYLSVEELSSTFIDPLDNLYSEEDFEMLVGRKIRIKTTDPEIQDEVVNVIGCVYDESITGDEVCQLELEEFPDHLLEPGEIQFIYLIGEDGSETLVEPSGGSIYNKVYEEEEEIIDETGEVEEFLSVEDFRNDIDYDLKPAVEGEYFYLQDLKLSQDQFEAVKESMRKWYVGGTSASFDEVIDKDVKVFDARRVSDWYKKYLPYLEIQDRPFSNYPALVIENKASKTERDFAIYDLLQLDRLAEDFDLRVENFQLMAGLSHEETALMKSDAMDDIKASIKNLQEFLKRYPSHVVALNSVGASLLSLGKNEESLVYFDKALKVHGNWLFPMANKIEALIQLNKLDEAKEWVSNAQKLEPMHGEWEWYLARIYERLNNKEEALKHAKESIKRGFELAKDLLDEF